MHSHLRDKAIANQIQFLGIDVIYTLMGCRYLYESIDFGVNSSIHNSRHEKWEDWMLEGEGIANGAMKEPSWQLVPE